MFSHAVPHFIENHWYIDGGKKETLYLTEVFSEGLRFYFLYELIN